MKVVFLACQQIGVDSIKIALKQGIDVPFVYTYELPLDELYGYTSVTKFCRKNGIMHSAGKKCNFEEIYKIKPDWIISVYYRRLIPGSVLRLASQGAVNLHPSLLPGYRGPVPTVWALLNGEKKTGITLHHLDEGIDTGPIIFQKEIEISNLETGFSLYKKCMRQGKQMMARFFKYLVERKKIPKKNQHPGGSYYGKVPSHITNLDWKKPSSELIRRIRTFTKPYGGSEAKLMNKRFIFWEASEKSAKNYQTGPPGKILKIEKRKAIVVSTIDGQIKITKYECLPKMHKNEEAIYLRPGNFFDQP